MQREDDPRLVEYRAILDYELAVGQQRFQTLAIFFAAVGFIIGLSQQTPSQAVGLLLLGVTAGLWVIDLKSRHILSMFRHRGAALEEAIFFDQGDRQLFRNRGGKEALSVLGILINQGVMVTPEQDSRIVRTISSGLVGAISVQVGIDVVFTSVACYASWVAFGTWAWTFPLLVLGGSWLIAICLDDPRRADFVEPPPDR